MPSLRSNYLKERILLAMQSFGNHGFPDFQILGMVSSFQISQPFTVLLSPLFDVIIERDTLH